MPQGGACAALRAGRQAGSYAGDSLEHLAAGAVSAAVLSQCFGAAAPLHLAGAVLGPQLAATVLLQRRKVGLGLSL